MAWITGADVEAALGRPLTEEEESRLDQALASAELRLVAALGWNPTPPTQAHILLAGTWNRRLRLPRRPVLEVEDLLVSTSGRAPEARVSGWWVQPPDWLIAHAPGFWGGSYGTVEMYLWAGFPELPLDLRALASELAAMLITQDPEAEGERWAGEGPVVSESLGPYRVQFGSKWDTLGAVWGGPDAILQRYQVTGTYTLIPER